MLSPPEGNVVPQWYIRGTPAQMPLEAARRPLAEPGAQNVGGTCPIPAGQRRPIAEGGSAGADGGAFRAAIAEAVVVEAAPAQCSLSRKIKNRRWPKTIAAKGAKAAELLY